MSLYSTVESGTKMYRSRFHKSISFSKKYDCKFGQCIPVLNKFVIPGDVWRIGGDALVRFHPMLSPSLTPSVLRVRYFFVPLRLIEPNTELIITGSNDGHLASGTLPVFKNIFDDADKVTDANCYKISKYRLYDYFGCQTGDYENFKTASFIPAAYWAKGYYRIKWDYYDDENIGSNHKTYADFETCWDAYKKHGGNINPFYAMLPKDYFTSALPWQLKAPGGVAPAINVIGNAILHPNFGNMFTGSYINPVGNEVVMGAQVNDDPERLRLYENVTGDNVSNAVETKVNDLVKGYLNQSQNVTISGLGFTVEDLRTITAQTRVFERLARCGSRYTEYLRSNFGTAPADETLQRAQYLGGWKLPIVTTEVLQMAEDGSTPVGTMRGHGITRGGNRINTFHAKEFGMIFGIAHILPQIEYTQGCPKEMSYKSRFDFFNPSFQHLSEQEIRNGELFVKDDNKNDDTFGFQAYANELRTSQNQTVGDLRENLSYWTQSIDFGTTRPNLDNSFIDSSSYLSNFNKCFAVNGGSAVPLIVQFYNDLDVYRPMVRYSTPGLVDHL